MVAAEVRTEVVARAKAGELLRAARWVGLACAKEQEKGAMMGFFFERWGRLGAVDGFRVHRELVESLEVMREVGFYIDTATPRKVADFLKRLPEGARVEVIAELGENGRLGKRVYLKSGDAILPGFNGAIPDYRKLGPFRGDAEPETSFLLDGPPIAQALESTLRLIRRSIRKHSWVHLEAKGGQLFVEVHSPAQVVLPRQAIPGVHVDGEWKHSYNPFFLRDALRMGDGTVGVRTYGRLHHFRSGKREAALVAEWDRIR